MERHLRVLGRLHRHRETVGDGLTTTSAVDVLRIRELYAATMTRARRHGVATGVRHEAVVKVLRTQSIRTPRGPYTVTAPCDFAEFVDLLYAACFAVIAYLVGARVSEILHPRSGCVRPFSTDGADTHSGVAVITGAILRRTAHSPHRHC